MATDTKEETKQTDDLEFLDEVNYSYRKMYHQRKGSPYPKHVLDRWTTDQPITDQEYKRIEKKFLDPDIGPDQLKDESA